MIYSPDPAANKSVGEPPIAENPEDDPLALSTSELGNPSALADVLIPPLFAVVNEGKFSSPEFVLVISVKSVPGASSLYAATIVDLSGLVVVKEIDATSSLKLPLVSLVLAK